MVACNGENKVIGKNIYRSNILKNNEGELVMRGIK
jgi:hypothetical protein